MLAARRLQNTCPQCTAQILKVYVHSIAETSSTATRTARQTIFRTRFREHETNVRFLSTSSRHSQEGGTENSGRNVQPDQLPEELALPENQDTETIVRQAKRMFGDTLPIGYLTEEEYKLYERLYGAPLRPTNPEDAGFGSIGETEAPGSHDPSKNLLFREDQHGRLEGVEYEMQSTTTGEDGETVITEEEAIVVARPPSDAQLEYIEANARNQREYDALIQLQKDFEAARIRAAQEMAGMEEVLEEEEEQEEEEQEEEEQDDEEDTEPEAKFLEWYPDHEGPRLHQYTIEGQMRTSPTTIYLPKLDFVEPITELLRRTDTTHIRAAAEKQFGGPGLPYSPATPKIGMTMPQKGLGIEAGHHRMSEIDADAFISTALPGIYASVMSTLVEVRRRLGPEWLRGLLNRKDSDGEGPRVLDAGAGGAGLSAWQNMLQAEWDLLREKQEVEGSEPPGKKTVVVGSNHLRHRISRFLQNTQFLPRLPNYVHSVENAEKQLDAPEVPQKRKVYDVIIATHLLVPLEKEWRRRETLDNLWSMLSPNGGVLVVLEKGHPRGFEAVAGVRDRLLNEFIIPPSQSPASKAIEQDPTKIREPGMIVAPCTNHSKCPMYLSPGLSPGRKDFCHFSQRFVRPPFLQRILGAKHRNHEDINFSFVAVRRGMPASTSPSVEPSSPAEEGAEILNLKTIRQGEEATAQAFAGYENVPADNIDRPHPLSLPRNILPPLKRKGHVTLDVCTPAGSIERWTIPRSFSKQAYHDARKAQWGDLWALGAKTRVRRAIRLGRGVVEGEPVPQDGGVRAARAAVSGKKGRPRVVELDMNATGVFGAKTRGLQPKRPERRTKGGRKPPRPSKPLQELEDDLDS